MTKVAIFDFNGTLVDDTKEWWICVTNIFKEAGRADEIPEVGTFIEAIDSCGGIFAAYQFFGVQWNAEQITTTYIETYAHLAGNIKLYPSTRSSLNALQKLGIVCGLVTFNWNRLLLPELIRLNLRDYFRHIAAEVNDKSFAIRKICQAEGAAFEECYYVGDMPSDITCAKQAGIKAVALLTELVPEFLLEERNPDYKIRCLNELPDIIIG